MDGISPIIYGSAEDDAGDSDGESYDE